MKLRPVEALNHPQIELMEKVLSPKVDPTIVKARAYQQLVTRQGLLPDKAKKLLGLEDS